MVFTGTTSLKVWLLLFLVPLWGCILASPATLAWHDWQRVVQVCLSLIAVGFLCVVWLSRRSPVLLDRQAVLLCVLVLVLGGISSWRAQQPLWAYTEMALMVACGCLALAFASLRVLYGKRGDLLLMFFVFFLCAVKISQYYSAVLSIFNGEQALFDTDLLLDGFSNKRFYGQFQTFTLSLLSLPLLLTGSSRSCRRGAFLLLCSWWLIAICGGTRGTWLGMLVASSVMVWLGSGGRRWVYWQLSAALLGGLLFWLLFDVLVGYLGSDVTNFAGDRLNSSLSQREIIWQLAWNMICERPWLGFGPMHFANIPNPVAAHPHQAVLQWGSEWGLASVLIVAWLALRGLFATGRLIRQTTDSTELPDLLRLCLFASLVGALTQAMVDGVIVMPYSQLWLALVVGWLMGLHNRRVEPATSNWALRGSGLLVSVAAVLLLAGVAIRDVPNLQARNEQYARDLGGYYQPRFWAQGVIAQPSP